MSEIIKKVEGGTYRLVEQTEEELSVGDPCNGCVAYYNGGRWLCRGLGMECAHREHHVWKEVEKEEGPDLGDLDFANLYEKKGRNQGEEHP